MEHRYCRRVEVGIPAVVGRRGTVLGRAVLRDVSDSGLGLELDRVWRFRPADVLTVQVDWRGRTVRIRGIVVHSGRGRLGMLADRDVRFLQEARFPEDQLPACAAGDLRGTC